MWDFKCNFLGVRIYAGRKLERTLEFKLPFRYPTDTLAYLPAYNDQLDVAAYECHEMTTRYASITKLQNGDITSMMALTMTRFHFQIMFLSTTC